MAMLALLIAQFSETKSPTEGWQGLIVFLILLLVGGIALLVHSVIEFRSSRKATKHEQQGIEDRNKRKAA
jgi:TRAP-type C4-dicarboxylate transport system permease small subunit